MGEVTVRAYSEFKISPRGSHGAGGILPARPSSKPHHSTLVSLICQWLGFWGRGGGMGRGAESPQAMISTMDKWVDT